MVDYVVMDILTISGKKYIASSLAAKNTSYTIDYLGQLCRAGKLDCQQVAGSWFITQDSISDYVGVEIKGDLENHMHDIQKDSRTKDKKDIRATPENKNIIIDGTEYIPSADIAAKTGYTQDYIGQLARSGEIPAKRIGRRWYADLKAVREHKKQKDVLLAKVQTDSVGLSKRSSLKKKGVSPKKIVPIAVTYKPERTKSLVLKGKLPKRKVSHKLYDSNKKTPPSLLQGKRITKTVGPRKGPVGLQAEVKRKYKAPQKKKINKYMYLWFILLCILIILVFMYKDLLIYGRVIEYSQGI